MNSRAKELMVMLLIQLVLTLPFYTANAYGLTISNVVVAREASNSATVEWQTDNISNGKVKYGKTTALGFTERHDNFIGNHTLSVFNGIEGDTTYFFSVESTNFEGITAVDNNSNRFYTFRTTDINPPPQVTGLAALSATSISIFLSWNSLNIDDLSHYVIYRDRIPIANSTASSFNDTNLSHASQFIYKVSAVDNSSNEGPLSDAVIASPAAIDSTAPAISNVDVLAITDASVRVTWLTDENSTSMVFYGINKTEKAKSSGDLVINHSIVIDGLTKNAKFVFAVKSCDSSNNCANSSIRSFTAGRDTTPPFVNLSIPRFVNRRVIDITGSTEPFSSVTLFVNDMNIPKRSLSSNEVGSSGKFIFSQVQLEHDNIIKIAIADKSGNKNQKIFEISVDAEDPVVKLDEIPSLTSKPNVTISGTVNEPVTIKVYVDADVNESSAPLKITGLAATKVGQNSVELHWNESEDKDFSHYVVYRSDSSPIAITKPANFNLFIDALVDSGKSYTYQVSAVNIFANEGLKSEPITATALKGGAILNLRPADVDIFEDFRKPSLVVNASNASGRFNFGVRLNKGDGNYRIKLIFEDRAGNSVLFDKNVALDSKKPEVRIISPPGGALIFENVANEIDVVGKTKPNARVHLFVDRTPFSFFNNSLQLSGLPNEIQDLPEAKLDAKCRISVSASFCKTGADFSVSADSQGNFKFERVDLTAVFGGAARLAEVPATELRDITLNPESRESRKTTLVVIATDQTGQRGVATQSVRLGTCWSGNQSWDVIPLTKYQSPTFISTERLAEGTETVYFYFNYSYIGRGNNAKITNVALSKACGSKEFLDPRFNISCQIVQSGNQPVRLNKEGTLSYSAVTLSRFPGMDRFLENDWKSFLKGISNEFTLPFKVQITYEHEVQDENGVFNKVKEVQTTCEQVSYVVDNSIIDPRKVLPDFLLYDFVDFLQSSIRTLTDAQENVNKLLNYVAVGCITSIYLTTFAQIYRRWVVFWDEKAYTVVKNARDIAKFAGIFQKNPLKASSQEDKDYCEGVITKIAESRGGFQMKYMTDADLRKCFPSSASAWDAEAKVYSFSRWSCDRVFGHAAPSRWTETKSDSELIKKIQKGDGCAVDQSVSGQMLRAVNCRSIQLSKYGEIPEHFGLDDKCFESSNGKESVLYTLGEQEGSSKIYKLNVGGNRRATSIYAIKRDETNYLTASSESCAKKCGVDPKSTSKNFELNKQPVTLSKKPNDKSGSEIVPYCTTVDICRGWNANKEIRDAEGRIHKITYATTAGYTSKVSSEDSSPCFYDAGKSENVVSDSTSTREECCCINAKETKGVTNYYQPDDKDISDQNKFVHESKSVSMEKPQSKPKPIGESEESTESTESYSDMEWSYRYWKEKFEAKGADGAIHKEYNPKRYIEGKDMPACFGQNNIIYDGFNQADGKVLTVDPFRDHAAALQCVHLAGISNRIQFIKNLMTSMSTCLIQVRTTGRADAGACKELFTQHLCGAIWQGIRAFIDGCAPIGAGVDLGKQDDDYGLTSVRTGFKVVYEGVSDTQKQITSEYGNAKLNEILGTGEESIVRKICLGAFGYDWELNARSLVDAAYATPFATLVQPVTKSREFLTVDPISLKPKYEYRASWLINPGCDFERYDVYLSCAGRKQLDQYPNSINCGALGAPSIGYTGALGTSTGYSQCDCINLPDEKIGPLVFSGKLKQNVLEDKVIPSGQRVQESNYRYDHLKFVLRPDRKITPKMKPNCFPQGYDDGVFYFPLTDKTARDILDCTADYVSGVFSCSGGTAFLGRKGTAELLEVTINGENANRVKELNIGDKLEVGARVMKTGKDKCLRVSMPGDPIQPVYAGITLNGTNDIAPILLTGSLSIQGRTGQVVAQGITSSLIAQNNQDPVVINVRAFDNSQKPDKVYSEDDRVLIDGIELNLNEEVVQGNDKIKINVRKVNDKKIITAEKEGAKIEIRDIQYTRTQSGQTQPDSYEYQGSITINPTQQATAASQQKTVIFEMFHLKDDRDEYGNNPDNCNINDRIGEPRKYSILVSQSKGVDSGKLGPVIQTPTLNPRAPNIGQTIVISARITHSSGVPGATLSITKPDGSKVFEPAQDMTKNGDVFEYVLGTDGMEKGKYSGNINARSRADTTSNAAFNFELKEPK